MKHLSGMLLLLLAFAACQREAGGDFERAERLNELSYRARYADIDSALHYAEQAEALATTNSDAWADARINKAFVRYQQMDFEAALDLLAEVERQSKNQFHLLSAHVLFMKIAQRVGNGEAFFRHRNQALRILSRADKGYNSVSPHYQSIIDYARSELHIVASTYYYYLGLDSAAMSEIQQAALYVDDHRDTAQWLNYNYMLGSGGLVEGRPDEVTRTEFGHLFLTDTLAAGRYPYFEANALQSLATMLSDSARLSVVCLYAPDDFRFLSERLVPGLPVDSLSLRMIRRSIQLFEDGKDRYQTACAYRTLGELFFQRGEYEQALQAFLHALSIVKEQQREHRLTVNPWMAGIREKLSMAYSALGNKPLSDENRNVYLDLLDQYRQNLESETRIADLKRELLRIKTSTVALALLILLTAFLAFLFVRRMKSGQQNHLARLASYETTDEFSRLATVAHEVCSKLSDEQELIEDQTNISRLHLEDYKAGNIERRAKVSMVYSIVPYLDRMMAEVDKMKDAGRADAERLQYVGELADEIMRINGLLTDWIKMSQGRLTLHVTTFPLQDIINLLALSRQTFESRGIRLVLPETTVQVKADKALTLFMINTLSDNARKFTPEGGEVRIEVSSTAQYAEISVSDSGVGLSEEDCATLNGSKVYDASEIGQPGQSKGFGFGIMNCKGIIQKYRKTSPLFDVCQFGVSSQLGHGSRFWFRLPLVLSLMALLFALPSRAIDDAEVYDSLYSYNVAGRYDASLRLGERFLSQLEEPFDTSYVVLIHNEIAVAALATHQWDVYRQSNDECVRLHKLFTQDDSIAAYSDRIEQLHRNGILLYLMLIFFALAALVLFYLLYLRRRLLSKQLFDDLSETFAAFRQLTQQNIQRYATSQLALLQQQAEADTFASEPPRYHQIIDQTVDPASPLSAPCHAVLDHIAEQNETVRRQLDQLFQAEDQRSRTSFEEDRLYVMNQILDNALSTIKHETMYYPARARQMVDRMLQDDAPADALQELSDLLRYYHDVYLILYHQAERQLEQNTFRRQTLDVLSLLDEFSAAQRRRHPELPLTFSAAPGLRVMADRSLLPTLLDSLLSAFLPGSSALRIAAELRQGIVLFTLSFSRPSPSDDEVQDMFGPGDSSIPRLIARQIIKEHDAHCGMPGLRLHAERQGEELLVRFTLLSQTIS